MSEDITKRARIAAATVGRPTPPRGVTQPDPEPDLHAAVEFQLDELKPGGLLHREIDGHMFTFIATNEEGIHSGRRRYCVVCSSCEKLAHEATTGPIENARRHVREASGR